MSEHFAKEMYREQIIELYKNPLNYGKLETPTHSQKEYNPLCGDEIEISIIYENNKIKDIKFTGEGCAISMASASLITEEIKGMNFNKINSLGSKEIINLLKIPISPTRIKCALLPLEAIKKAIK